MINHKYSSNLKISPSQIISQSLFVFSLPVLSILLIGIAHKGILLSMIIFFLVSSFIFSIGRSIYYRLYGVAVGIVLLFPLIASAMISISGIYDILITQEALQIGEPAAIPSISSILGRDYSGEDILKSILISSGNTYTISLLATIIGSAMGIVLGIAMTDGYYPIRQIASATIQTLETLPQIFFLLIVLAVYNFIIYKSDVHGIPSNLGIIIVGISLGFTLAPSMASLVKLKVNHLKEYDFVSNLRLAGVSNTKILLYNLIWRNSIGDIIIQATYFFGASLLIEATLNFVYRLGFGDLGTGGYLSLGGMLADGRSAILFKENLWIPAAPSAMIVLSLLGMRLIGDGIATKLRKEVS